MTIHRTVKDSVRVQMRLEECCKIYYLGEAQSSSISPFRLVQAAKMIADHPRTNQFMKISTFANSLSATRCSLSLNVGRVFAIDLHRCGGHVRISIRQLSAGRLQRGNLDLFLDVAVMVIDAMCAKG